MVKGAAGHFLDNCPKAYLGRISDLAGALKGEKYWNETIFARFWNFPPFSPCKTHGRKARNISKPCKNRAHGTSYNMLAHFSSHQLIPVPVRLARAFRQKYFQSCVPVVHSGQFCRWLNSITRDILRFSSALYWQWQSVNVSLTVTECHCHEIERFTT